MRPPLRAAFVTALVASLAAACAALTDLQPLEFIDTTDGGATDASRDGGADGGQLDARADSADAAEAAVFAGCTLVDADLCDDFDHGEGFPVRWSFMVTPQGPCSLTTSTAESLTKPSSLRVESLSNDAMAAVSVALQKNLPGFVGELSASFDVFFKVAPTGGTFLLQPFLTPTYPNNNDAVNPFIAAFPNDGGVMITAFNLVPFTGDKGEPLAYVPVGKWTHVELSVRRDVDAASTVETFTVENGVGTVTRKVATETPVAVPAAFVGIQSGGSIVEVFFDNVVMKTR